MSSVQVSRDKRYPSGLRLIQQPIAELKALRREHFHCTTVDIATANAQLEAWNNKSVALETAVEFMTQKTTDFGLKIRQGSSEQTVIGYSPQDKQVFIDRHQSGNVSFSPSFAGRYSGSLSTN